MLNLYDLFCQTARRSAGRPGPSWSRSPDALTYRTLQEAINTAGDRLRQAGVRRGDCIGLHCPSGANYIILSYAVWSCGRLRCAHSGRVDGRGKGRNLPGNLP